MEESLDFSFDREEGLPSLLSFLPGPSEIVDSHLQEDLKGHTMQGEHINKALHISESRTILLTKRAVMVSVPPRLAEPKIWGIFIGLLSIVLIPDLKGD